MKLDTNHSPALWATIIALAGLHIPTAAPSQTAANRPETLKVVRPLEIPDRIPPQMELPVDANAPGFGFDLATGLPGREQAPQGRVKVEVVGFALGAILGGIVGASKSPSRSWDHGGFESMADVSTGVARTAVMIAWGFAGAAVGGITLGLLGRGVSIGLGF